MRIARTGTGHRNGSGQRWHDPKARLIIRRTSRVSKRPHRTSLGVATHTLQLAGLIRRDLLTRRATLIVNVVQCDTDGYGIADMSDEVGTRDAERHGRVVDIVDEVVHVWAREIHEAMDLGLGCRTGVFRERGVCTSEDEAKVLVEMCHHLVLIGGRVPCRDAAEESGRGATVEEIECGGTAVAVGAGVGAVEVGDEVDGGDSETGVTVDGFGVEDAAGLVGAVWVGGPEIGQWDEVACEGEVDELTDPCVLRAVGWRVLLAYRLGGFVERVWYKRVEGKVDDLDGEEVALVLGSDLAEERKQQGKKDSKLHDCGGVRFQWEKGVGFCQRGNCVLRKSKEKSTLALRCCDPFQVTAVLRLLPSSAVSRCTSCRVSGTREHAYKSDRR